MSNVSLVGAGASERDDHSDLPAEWQTVSLGDLLAEKKVRARDLDGAIDAPVLSLTKNAGLIEQTERFHHRVARSDVADYKVVQRGWLVYNPFVLWEGAIHVLRAPEIGLVSPSYVVFEVSSADPTFMDCLVKTPRMLAEFVRLSSGVVQRRRSIKKQAFLGITVSIPRLDVQQAIARRVALVDDAIAASRDALETNADLERSLVSESIAAVRADWTQTTVGEVIAKAQYGLSVRGTEDGAYPMLRMNSLADGGVAADNLQFVDLPDDEFRKFRLEGGDLLFNRTNSIARVGKTGLFDLTGDYVFASYLIRLCVDEAVVTPEFLNIFLNAPATQRRLKQLATRGVSQSNINASKLKALAIDLPPLSEQRRIVKQAQAVRAARNTEAGVLASLAQLRASLLQKLLPSPEGF